MELPELLEHVAPGLHLGLGVLHPGDLLAVPAGVHAENVTTRNMSLEDHGEVPEEMSPLPVDWVLEARVVGVQVRAVHQHLLAVVQVTDHLQGVIIRGSGSWNNGKEVPRWGVAEIQKMSPSTIGRCK